MGRFLDEPQAGVQPTTYRGKFLDEQPPTPQPVSPTQSKSGGIDFNQLLNTARHSAFSPTPQDTAMGGMDMAQRVGQATLGNLYGQARGQINESIPQDFKRNVGRGITSMLPYGLGNRVPQQAQDIVGDVGTGVGVDLLTGLATGGGLKIGSFLKGAGKNRGANHIKFLEDVRGAFQQVPRDARASFADDLVRLNNEKIMMGKNANVDLTPMVDNILGDIRVGEEAPVIKEAINRIPMLKKLLKNPDMAERLTLKESQDLLNEVNATISQSKLGGVGNRATDIPLYEDVINYISQAQLETHPEMAGVKKVFGDVMNNYKLVRNKIKVGSLEKNIQSKFGDAEIQNAVKKLLSGREDILKRMGRYRIGKITKKVATGVAGVATAEEVARRYFLRK